MNASYYNENDAFAAAWLRALIGRGLIAPGEVDTRSIVDVRPSDLAGFRQCHFFAGIGVWSYALRCAGWADDRPVWTGSCPCQPFSAAGKGKAFADERHLWPAWHRLIAERRPPVVLGEQVASKDGLAWLDLVHADLEGADYAVGALDLCAAGFGAPHIRQRLYWVADATNGGREPGSRQSGIQTNEIWLDPIPQSGADICDGGLAHANNPRLEGRRQPGCERAAERSAGPGGVAGFWTGAEWIPCRDGRQRPVEPGTFPLAHGAAGRVGRLRGYGNALVAPVAQTFIEAVMEVMP